MSLTLRTWLRSLAALGLLTFAPAVFADDASLGGAQPTAEASDTPNEEDGGDQEPPAAVDAPRQRQAALKAVDAVLGRLNREGKTGQGWNRFLGLNALRARLNAAPTETLQQESGVLRSLLRRLRRGSPGLNRPDYVALDRAVSAHLAGLVKANAADYDAENSELFSQRDALFAKWRVSRDARDRRALVDVLDKLEERGLAGPKTQAIVAKAAYPNLVFHANESLLAAALEQPINDTSPVSSNSGGASIRGVAHTTGVIDVSVLDSPRGALIGVRVNGHVGTRTTAAKGPVAVRNAGSTVFVVNSSLTIHGDGLHPGPTTANSRTNIDVQGISTSFRRPLDRLVKKIAPRVIRKQEGKIEAQANGEARQRAQSEFETRLAQAAAKANRDLEANVFKPLRDQGAFPHEIKFSSSQRFIHGAWTQSRGVQLASATAPPTWDRTATAAVQIHESHLENFAWDLLAGRLIGPKEMQDIAKKLTGKVPKELQNRDKNDVAAVEFDAHRPASFAFAENGATIVLHISSFYANDRRYGAMNIQADYQFQRLGGQWMAVRQGELKIAPPSGKLGSSQIAMRRILRGQFDKIFTEQIEMKPIEMKGELSKLGSLAIKSLNTYHGWLTVALDPTAGRERYTRDRVAHSR